jgi:hypothetical protein
MKQLYNTITMKLALWLLDGRMTDNEEMMHLAVDAAELRASDAITEHDQTRRELYDCKFKLNRAINEADATFGDLVRLVSIIYQDGGSYIDQYGKEKAVHDAVSRISSLKSDAYQLEDCKLKCVNLQMQILELKRKARKTTTIKKRKPK